MRPFGKKLCKLAPKRTVAHHAIRVYLGYINPTEFLWEGLGELERGGQDLELFPGHQLSDSPLEEGPQDQTFALY